MAAAHGLVLAHRQHDAALGVRERRVIEVLADVVLVLTNGAVVGEREVLGVDQVDRQRPAADVLERDMPEPRGRVLREPQRHLEADVAPGSARREAVLADPEAGAAGGTEQRDRVAASVAPAQIEVGRPPLDFVARKQIHDDVAMIDAPERTVAVDLHAQAGCAGEADGRRHVASCRRLVRKVPFAWAQAGFERDAPPGALGELPAARQALEGAGPLGHGEQRGVRQLLRQHFVYLRLHRLVEVRCRLVEDDPVGLL